MPHQHTKGVVSSVKAPDEPGRAEPVPGIKKAGSAGLGHSCRYSYIRGQSVLISTLWTGDPADQPACCLYPDTKKRTGFWAQSVNASSVSWDAEVVN